MPDDDAELVKAGVQGIVEGSLKPFSDLITSLFGPAASEAGLMLKDHVQHFRLLRQVRLFERTAARLQEAGIQPKSVPLKLLLPIIDNASLETDDDLQDIWANLLANAAGSREDDVITPSFPLILKELRSRDVKFLDALFMEAWNQRGRRPGVNEVEEVKLNKTDLYIIHARTGLAKFSLVQTPSSKDWENEDFKNDVSNVDLSVDTFERNRIFVQVYEVPIRKGNTNTFALGINYSFTHLGMCFVKACRDPNEPLPPKWEPGI